jgi:hypothetical protein
MPVSLHVDIKGGSESKAEMTFLEVFATADMRRRWIELFLRPSITEALVSFVNALLIAALRQMEDFDALCLEEFVEQFGEVKRAPRASTAARGHGPDLEDGCILTFYIESAL